MINQNEIETLVINSLEEYMNLFGEVNETNFQLDMKQNLFKKDNGILDSFGLVSLLAILEDKIEATYNVRVVIADDRAFSMKQSPFYNINRLSKYINDLLEEHYNE